MGYTVLYIAFGVVALWLLGEVLLQYKARLRWRVLAFAGFLGVVAGVVLPQVIVIVLGALAFGTGQTQVTLSYRRGFSTGWSIGGRPGSSRRRRSTAEPALDVSDAEAAENAEAAQNAEYAENAGYAANTGYADQAEYGGYGDQGEYGGPADPLGVAEGFEDVAEPVPAGSTQAFGAGYDEHTGRPQFYSPTPLPEETGEYGIYSDRSSYVSDPYTSGGFEGYGAQGHGAPWQEEPQPATAYAYDTFAPGTAADDVFANGAMGRPAGQDPAPGGYDQQHYPQQPYQSYESQETYNSYAAPQPADPASYDSYGQYPPQQDYAGYQQYPQGTYQDPYQQSYGYAAQPGQEWAPADPYGGPQPHIPQQQATPPYGRPQPGEPQDEQQPSPESYQPYGY